MHDLLVVAGEASGDALAAEVLDDLRAPSFGLGGRRLAGAGAELVADVGSFSAMGVTAVLPRVSRLALALGALAVAVRRRRPAAALLVGFSEANARVADWLKRRGTRTLWYAPPQVWAWRPERAPSIAKNCERLAVLLPFEAPHWARSGARVDYVGHPAASRVSAAPARRAVALLPGSRSHEVRAHLPPLLAASRRLMESGFDAELVLAEGLDARTTSWAERRARESGVRVVRRGVTEIAGAAAAVVASGTATLECAALGVPPVIVYRTDPLTFAVAARLVRVDHVGLPNLVLGERAFPELLQREVTPRAIAGALSEVLRDGERYRALCGKVRGALRDSLDDRRPSERVAAMLRPWLD
ncbi:MAG TPA: lipid-A-disaccharide synthase [Polyangiaceae bacterium]|nr:lipid-A-disaccharide synthase [Polyangiaceae bacterium]